MVTAGLKWPPLLLVSSGGRRRPDLCLAMGDHIMGEMTGMAYEVGAQTMMAKAMPRAKPQPMEKSEPYAATMLDVSGFAAACCGRTTRGSDRQHWQAHAGAIWATEQRQRRRQQQRQQQQREQEKGGPKTHEGEGSRGGDAAVDVEEDAGGLCGHLAQPAGATGLEVELALGDGAALDDVARVVALDGVGDAELDVAGGGDDGVGTREIRHGWAGRGGACGLACARAVSGAMKAGAAGRRGGGERRRGRIEKVTRKVMNG